MKAKSRAEKVAQKAAQVATPTQEVAALQADQRGGASKDLADFSNEYAGLKLSIKVEGLGEVEGRLLKASRSGLSLSLVVGSSTSTRPT